MENDDDIDSQVKQAVDDEEAAEQPSIKINAQGLEADIRVREQEDLETVIANLEFLARRNGLDTDLLGNRSVDREDDRVEQLNDVVTTVAENVQELNERVDRVEDELGGGEDSQLAEVIDRIQELEDSVQELPEDVSRHLGELREEVKALEEYIDDVEEYATSVDNELESLRQKTSDREEKQESSETVESEDVDEETTTGESEDDVDEKEDEGEGLFRTVSAFKRLSKAQREDEIKQVIKEYEPIGTSEICEKLFGYEAKSGTDAYVAVQNAMQDFRDELEKEKDGRSTKYSFPEGQETEDQGASLSDEAGPEEVMGSEEPGDPSTATEPEDLEPVEQISDDRKDFSKCGGRHTLQEIREKDDLSIEAQVLKAFQEYGLISIPEATQVIFGFEASEEDEEYQVVWNQLSDHKAKEGKRVETTEREGEETLYEVFGPFKLSNLYYDSLHKLICATCAPDPDAVFESKKEAVDHKIETKNDEVVDKHDLFVSGSIPSDWHKKQKTVEQVVNRECGNQ